MSGIAVRPSEDDLVLPKGPKEVLSLKRGGIYALVLTRSLSQIEKANMQEKIWAIKKRLNISFILIGPGVHIAHLSEDEETLP